MSTHRPRHDAEPDRTSSLTNLVRAAPFSGVLSPAELERVERDLHERSFASGGHVAWKGDVVEHWMVVASGMVKVEAAAADGRKTTLIGITGGGWFGETALLQGGRWPFDVLASRGTRLGLLPRATFEWLLDSSIGFNRFLLGQVNARLWQFVQRCEHLRFCEAGEHVAHCLGELFDERLYPRATLRLPLSQDEVAQLAGISRPTAHRALHELERRGVLSVAYGTVVIHDPAALQRLGSLH